MQLSGSGTWKDRSRPTSEEHGIQAKDKYLDEVNCWIKASMEDSNFNTLHLPKTQQSASRQLESAAL